MTTRASTDRGQPVVLFADTKARGLTRMQERLGDNTIVKALPETTEERRQSLSEASVVVAASWQIPLDEIGFFERLGLVQRLWSGVEALPIDALVAARPRLRIAGNPGPNAPHVAAHAVGLLLDAARGISLRDRAAREGSWLQQQPEGTAIAGARFAVLGLGAVGSRVATALDALGARVLGVNRDGRPSTVDSVDQTCSLDAFHEHLPELQGIIICLPLTRRTRGLVDAAFLERMRDDAIIVNVARGRIIDEDALFHHLQAHPRLRAALDAWWHYPRQRPTRFEQAHSFEALDNVTITPHSAYNVAGVHDAMVDAAAANIDRWIRTGHADHAIDANEYA